MAKFALALVVLLGLAVAQQTCPCSRNTGPSCSGIVSLGDSRCDATTSACSGCACNLAGSEVCEVTTELALKFNGTANFCELEPVAIAACPNVAPPSTEQRQCCFSGTQGFLVTCDLAPRVQGFNSFSYDYNVEGLGSFVFQQPSQSLQVTIQMTASSTALIGPAFMTPQVGTNTTSVVVPPLQQSLTTTYSQSVGPQTSGAQFTYLQGASSFQFLLSANLGESGGDASRSSVLEGCFDFTFTI
eukprot:CAMPEP_0174891966 /NCGR_PEP_ID=MMETSP0167-20121228/6972_1 /TAXON_ID=38298 /ORGANISM="Rhodella maculata, Strain CCMP736" /LENGTH=243 /DNA_ID=CAMNT_0016130303 /DNA_START=572 /DNA_END=1303 /DNA_ORIENTATION=-